VDIHAYAGELFAQRRELGHHGPQGRSPCEAQSPLEDAALVPRA
jgi:hypothetical protein